MKNSVPVGVGQLETRGYKLRLAEQFMQTLRNKAIYQQNVFAVDCDTETALVVMEVMRLGLARIYSEPDFATRVLSRTRRMT